jgi:hypothetical protein
MFNRQNTYVTAVFSFHATQEMSRRGISEATVREILDNYDDVQPVRQNRVVVQKTIFAEDLGKALLYRVFLDIEDKPPVVVTVYRTSKIEKYGSNP